MMEWLQKFLQRNMQISRRRAVELIKKKAVKVNNIVVKDLGLKVSSTDKVEVENKIVSEKPHKLVYIILNKPKRYITSLKDPQGRKTVIDIFNGKIGERVFPVGRLDYLTTGLLILTNDGDFYQTLIHPSFSKAKVYRALVTGKITNKDIIYFSNMEINGKFINDARLRVLREFDKNTLVEVTIFQGLNRQIRKMFEKIGKDVLYLKRIRIGPFFLDKNLKEGQWRFFNQNEMKIVKEMKNELEKHIGRT